MYKIIIKGQATTDYKNLSELDGIDCQDNFAEYFDNDFTFKDDIKHGYMHFSFENEKLWTITEYSSKRELSKEELEILSDYTQGQWSDGIGEGFEQEPCYYDNTDFLPYSEDEYDEDELKESEVFISPWFHGQEVEILVEEII